MIAARVIIAATRTDDPETESVTCPVCMYDPGEPTDPLGLCRKHRRQLEELKEQNHHGRT